MPADIAGDELAAGDNFPLAGTGIIERQFCQSGAVTFALVPLAHFGMTEHHRVAFEIVFGNADDLAIIDQFVTTITNVVP